MNTFNDLEGGRSIARGFMDLFRVPLATLVIQKKVKSGQMLLVGLSENGEELDFKTTTKRGLLDADKASKLAPELTDSKNRMLSRSKAQKLQRASRAATAELVIKLFNPDSLVSEGAFRAVKRGK